MDSQHSCIPARECFYSCTLVAVNLGPDPDSSSNGLKGGCVSSMLIIVVLNYSQLLQATSKNNFPTVERET